MWQQQQQTCQHHELSELYLGLIPEFEQRLPDLLGGEVHDVHRRGLALGDGGVGGDGGHGRHGDRDRGELRDILTVGGRVEVPGVRLGLQLMDGEGDGAGGGGEGGAFPVRGEVGGGAARAQHQPRVYGGCGRGGVENLMEDAEVTDHQILRFQIDWHSGVRRPLLSSHMYSVSLDLELEYTAWVDGMLGKC